jgi:uncharacterized protein
METETLQVIPKTRCSTLDVPARNPNVSNFTVNALHQNPCVKIVAVAKSVRITHITLKIGMMPFKLFSCAIQVHLRQSSKLRGRELALLRIKTVANVEEALA